MTMTLILFINLLLTKLYISYFSNLNTSWLFRFSSCSLSYNVILFGVNSLYYIIPYCQAFGGLTSAIEVV